ncbi:MAG: hypothetical protein Kow0074_11380 [Candidatus Zixiibacteriota bacterium]
MVGERIKQYEIISQLGAGGMGEVYLAKDTRLDRQVALKFLPREIAGDVDRRKRLELEARTASSLDHPNILTIYEIDDHDGRPFIAMAYVKGGSLRERIERGPIDIEEAARYAVQIASGLGAAHARGIIHRDIKPDNVLIDENNRARLTDFGLAKIKESTGLTGRGTAVGTVGYMSPEQAQGLEVDARSDVFSLGVLLYELFTGKKPFVAEHAAAALYSIVHEMPTPVREINPDIPEPIADVVERALAKNPSDRYPDARAVETELRKIARDLEFSRVSSSSGAYRVTSAPTPKSRVAWMIAAGFIIIAGLILIFSPGYFSSDKAEVKATENSLAVMYFENLSDPEDEERLGDIITELLTTDLSGSNYLKVISTQRLHDLLAQDSYTDRKRIDRDIATKIASKAGASRMLIGTLSKLGGRTIITAQLVDVSTGEIVGSQRVDGTDVFAVVDDLSTRIKEQIGLTGAELYAGDKPVSEATTASAEAYREYLIGMDYYHSLEWEQAHKHFDRAIELDSSFALAYLRKGVAYSSDGQRERGLEMLRTAGRYIDRTTGCDRLLLQAFAVNFAQDLDMDAMLATLKTAAAQCPTHKEPFFWVANLLSGRPGKEDTVKLYAERALELDPNYPFALLMLANVHIRQHEYDQARPIVERYMTARPRDVLPYGLLSSILINTGRLDSAMVVAKSAVEIDSNNRLPMTTLVSIFVLRNEPDSAFVWAERIQSLESSPFNEVFGLRLIAKIHSTWGEFQQSESYLKQSVQSALAANLNSQASGSQRMFGTLYRDLNMHDKALQQFQEADEYDTLTSEFSTVKALAELGRADEAHQLLEKLIGRWGGVMDSTYLRMGILEVEGILALRGDDPATAIDSFLEVRVVSGDSTAMRYHLGRAYLAAGKYSNAIAELTAFHEENRNEWPSGRYIASHLDLARAYEKAGQPAEARDALAYLLSYWGNADWDVPLINEAKHMHQRLATQL